MEEVFDMKVQEKLQKLKDIESDVSDPQNSCPQLYFYVRLIVLAKI